MALNVPGMFSANRLKVHLRLAVNRLQLSQQKMASLNASHRKEISLLLEKGKIESARIRVEHIIRDDLTQEAYELIELYCELLLARFGLVVSMPQCDPALLEAVHSIIYAAPRSDIKELHSVKDMLVLKYGRDFAISALENRSDMVCRRVIQKLRVETPKRTLVTMYLKEIADAYKVDWTPDPAEISDTDGGHLSDELDAVRTDPTGTYTLYDASQLRLDPSTGVPKTPLIPPRISSSHYILEHVPINLPTYDAQHRGPVLEVQPVVPMPQPMPPVQHSAPDTTSPNPPLYAPSPHQPPHMIHQSSGSPPSPLQPTHSFSQPSSSVHSPPSPFMIKQSISSTTSPLSPPRPNILSSSSGTLVRHPSDPHIDKMYIPAEGIVPQFPSIPSAPPIPQKTPDPKPPATHSDLDFDELAKRFEALKRKK